MREIKFRGYDVENETMYYSNNAFHFNSPLRECDIKNAPFELNELMQFTGLKDKNGVEIYEGDIISFVTEKTCYDGLPLNTNRIGKVFWMEFRSLFAIQINNFMNQDLYKFIQYDNTVEIIGNIYENPELLSTPTAVL